LGEEQRLSIVKNSDRIIRKPKTDAAILKRGLHNTIKSRGLALQPIISLGLLVDVWPRSYTEVSG
jgi:hypothetical protein